MENVFLTSLTTPEVRELFRTELSKFFSENLPKPPAEPQPEQEFSILGLAHYLNCTKATIHAYKRRGVFPYYQTGRTVYFKKSEVDKALEVGNKKKGAKA
jgi:excisionase family DNA binding protein